MARAQGVQVAFVALPYYTGPATLQEQAFYQRHGPVWNAAFLAPRKQLFADYGHLTSQGQTFSPNGSRAGRRRARDPRMTSTDPPLHHVGIVQPDEETAQAVMQTLGLSELYRGFVPQFDALCIFTQAPIGSSPIEFVIPAGGPLARFNKGAGGLHHIALEVPNLVATMAEFAQRDMRMIEPEPVKGAGNFLCNFLSPVATRGIIVEYVQVLG